MTPFDLNNKSDINRNLLLGILPNEKLIPVEYEGDLFFDIETLSQKGIREIEKAPEQLNMILIYWWELIETRN